MCVSPKWFRNLVAKTLGAIACMAIPKWRMEMAKANVTIDNTGQNEVKTKPESEEFNDEQN